MTEENLGSAEGFENECELICEKTGTELDLSVIEWEWVDDTEQKCEQNHDFEDFKITLKAVRMRQLILFASLAFLAFCSSLAASRIEPIFKNKAIPVPVVEQNLYTEFTGWNLSFMTLDLMNYISESLDAHFPVNSIKSRISSAVPPIVTKKFQELQNSQTIYSLFGYYAQLATIAVDISSSTFSVLHDMSSIMKKFSVDTISKVKSSEAYKSIVSKSFSIIHDWESLIEKNGKAMIKHVKISNIYQSLRQKLQQMMTEEKYFLFPWFKANRDPCQKWLGSNWFDRFLYSICSAWEKNEIWEWLWPKANACDNLFCFW